jgi:hypothetical protein
LWAEKAPEISGIAILVFAGILDIRRGFVKRIGARGRCG